MLKKHGRHSNVGMFLVDIRRKVYLAPVAPHTPYFCLSLLHLAPEVRSLILSLGDPIRRKALGIHTLRYLLHLPVDKQIGPD